MKIYKKLFIKARMISRYYYYEIKYAFQRMFRGYDDADVFDCDKNFIQRMTRILKDFRKNNIGCFEGLTFEQTCDILDMMIKLFELSEEDVIIKQHYESINDPTATPTMDVILSARETAKQNRKDALDLFCEFFDGLWL